MKFHEHLTARELREGDVTCPVCWEVDKYQAILLEASSFETSDETWYLNGIVSLLGLVKLTCANCDFELLKRTPREAIYIEDCGNKHQP